MEWIDFDLKTPEENQWVVCWFLTMTHTGKFMIAQYYDGGFYVNGNRYSASHWFIPEPPKN